MKKKKTTIPSIRLSALLTVLAIALAPASPACLALTAQAPPAPLVPSPPSIAGDYLEARTADVYTGACFANSEVNLTGKEAVVAWRVRQGSWQGVPVDGLAVVAAVRASATLGDPFANPLPAHAVVMVDQRATPAQRQALLGFARAMAGDLLSQVVRVESAPIDFRVSDRKQPPAHAGHAEHADQAQHAAHLAASGQAQAQPVVASLRAGEWIELSTRGLSHDDQICGNEELYYPPLTATTSAVPAVTVVYGYSGPGLGKTWSSPGKRSAFVGQFAL
jgi:hypothetical protein